MTRGQVGLFANLMAGVKVEGPSCCFCFACACGGEAVECRRPKTLPGSTRSLPAGDEECGVALRWAWLQAGALTWPHACPSHQRIAHSREGVRCGHCSTEAHGLSSVSLTSCSGHYWPKEPWGREAGRSLLPSAGARVRGRWVRSCGASWLRQGCGGLGRSQ